MTDSSESESSGCESSESEKKDEPQMSMDEGFYHSSFFKFQTNP